MFPFVSVQAAAVPLLAALFLSSSKMGGEMGKREAEAAAFVAFASDAKRALEVLLAAYFGSPKIHREKNKRARTNALFLSTQSGSTSAEAGGKCCSDYSGKGTASHSQKTSRFV